MSERRAKRQRRDAAHEVPEPYNRLIETVMDRDREHFEQHHEAWEYIRPYVPGEFWPLHCDQLAVVRVRQIARGLRVREFVPDGPGPVIWQPVNADATEMAIKAITTAATAPDWLTAER